MTNTQTVCPLEGGLSTTLAVGLGIVLVVEGAAIHLWIAERSPWWAWVITALNVATLFGHAAPGWRSAHGPPAKART